MISDYHHLLHLLVVPCTQSQSLTRIDFTWLCHKLIYGAAVKVVFMISLGYQQADRLLDATILAPFIMFCRRFCQSGVS